jgi:hypothetical protein
MEEHPLRTDLSLVLLTNDHLQVDYYDLQVVFKQIKVILELSNKRINK